MTITHVDCSLPTGPAAWPEAREVHLFTIPLDGAFDVDALKDCLDDAELQRMNRYSVEKPRRDFLVTRASLKLILMNYLDVPRAQDIVVTQSAHGKPAVKGSGLHFNVSHSGDVALIALARQRIGVDVELIRAMPNADGLVKRFFSSAEATQYTSLPEEYRVAAFFRGWTAKESLLKAVGVGLVDLESCVVDLDPRQPERIIRFYQPGDWDLKSFNVLDKYIASIAIGL